MYRFFALGLVTRASSAVHARGGARLPRAAGAPLPRRRGFQPKRRLPSQASLCNDRRGCRGSDPTGPAQRRGGDHAPRSARAARGPRGDERAERRAERGRSAEAGPCGAVSCGTRADVAWWGCIEGVPSMVDDKPALCAGGFHRRCACLPSGNTLECGALVRFEGEGAEV